MNIYDITVKKRTGEVIELGQYKGKVLLIVNTATGCGFTPQYEALENLYKAYHEKGLEVLDFPCNQFGKQAPGSNDEIHEFCQLKYNTSFDQFDKIEVNGENEETLFKYLKANAPEEIVNGMKNKIAMKGIKKLSNTCKNEKDIIWNFTKFLVDKEGNAVLRVSPIESPMIMEDKIKELL